MMTADLIAVHSCSFNVSFVVAAVVLTPAIVLPIFRMRSLEIRKGNRAPGTVGHLVWDQRYAGSPITRLRLRIHCLMLEGYWIFRDLGCVSRKIVDRRIDERLSPMRSKTFCCRSRRRWVGGYACRLSRRLRRDIVRPKKLWIRLCNRETFRPPVRSWRTLWIQRKRSERDRPAIPARFHYLITLGRLTYRLPLICAETVDHELLHFLQQAANNTFRIEAYHALPPRRFPVGRPKPRSWLYYWTFIWTEVTANLIGSTLIVAIAAVLITVVISAKLAASRAMQN
jgi:hypothetical protein